MLIVEGTVKIHANCSLNMSAKIIECHLFLYLHGSDSVILVLITTECTLDMYANAVIQFTSKKVI